MKCSFLKAALIAWPLLTLPVVEAAYNPAIVAADARWVIHADLEALRTSTLGKEIVVAIDAAQKHATGGMIGIDIPKLIMLVGGLTAYGTNLSADPKLIDGTLIAQGGANLRK